MPTSFSQEQRQQHVQAWRQSGLTIRPASAYFFTVIARELSATAAIERFLGNH